MISAVSACLLLLSVCDGEPKNQVRLSNDRKHSQKKGKRRRKRKREADQSVDGKKKSMKREEKSCLVLLVSRLQTEAKLETVK